MNTNDINILCATDDKYLPYCGVMITSLFENNKDRNVSVFIMVSKPLTKDNQEKIKQISKKYSQFITFITVDNSFLLQFPLKGDGIEHWSVATYYRLYAAELFSKDIKHILYLDCDIIVNGSLSKLFDFDWSNYGVGVVDDMCVEWEEFYSRLQYDRKLGYFNAGVVFMNLDYWRRQDISKKCLEFLSEHYDRIYNNDQDVLNYVLRNCKKKLPVTYNYQIQLRMPYFYNTFTQDMKDDVLKTKDPIIIHYAAELKPWMVRYYSYPFNSVWHKYKNKSLWKSMPD